MIQAYDLVGERAQLTCSRPASRDRCPADTDRVRAEDREHAQVFAHVTLQGRMLRRRVGDTSLLTHN